MLSYILVPFFCYKLYFCADNVIFKNAPSIFNTMGDGTWTQQVTFAFHANIPLNSSHTENI